MILNKGYAMEIKTFKTGPFQVNTYLVYDNKSKEGILIDVGGSADEIVDTVNELGISVKYILNTHGHFDHILGAKEICEKLNIGFYIHEGDAIFVESLEDQLELYGFPPVTPPQIKGLITKDSDFSIGNTKIEIIETPGHTPGGICLLIDNILFSGDTLFYESVGRTDLPGGDYNTLQNSIKNKLFTLDESLIVYPGHEQSTTIAHEKQWNQFV